MVDLAEIIIACRENAYWSENVFAVRYSNDCGCLLVTIEFCVISKILYEKEEYNNILHRRNILNCYTQSPAFVRRVNSRTFPSTRRTSSSNSL